TQPDPKAARLVGITFSFARGAGYYVPVPKEDSEAKSILEEFREVFESERIEKTGHNLKFDINVLQHQGIRVRGKLFDTMVAHSLIEPEIRHNLGFMAEVYLGYSPIPITRLIGDEKGPQLDMVDVPVQKVSDYAVEGADVTLQLRAAVTPLLKERGQE